ncbi:MAG: response regulator [Sedimentisphaerales bacterium]|jgi:CheY-like chemotaxis protein|nr:response regulator [Sedimentisphaerales bacterium]
MISGGKMRQCRNIVFIEDDQLEAMMVKEAITKADVDAALVHLTDGCRALDYLQDRSRQRPSLILLDLDLPKMDGLAVLAAIRADPELMTTPVVIFRASEDPEVIEEAFRCGAAATSSSL